MSLERDIIGREPGAAHLRFAWQDFGGNLCRVGEWAAPLWQGLQYLDRTLDRLSGESPLGAREYRLTVTGELPELVADREVGSEQDWRLLAAYLADRQLDVLSLAGQRHFSRGPAASASLIAAGVGRFLVQRLARRLGRDHIDIGSLFGEATVFDEGEAGTIALADCASAVAVAGLGVGEAVVCA